jgi:S1-C subfamily serine protease
LRTRRVRNNRWVEQPNLNRAPGAPRGGESRSVVVLMATTFVAALCVVIIAVLVGGTVGASPPPVLPVAVVSDPVVARVDSELVDINTITDGGTGAAAGTGMVLTPSGLVLTNNHVIAQATSIEAVDIGNGQTYTARVLGYDERRDVALIQLEGASGLAAVTLGDSAHVHVGGQVVTIGNAGGVGGTPAARSGTVLALNRAIVVSDAYDRSSEHLTQLIQIHGDLQPGDSGGPLVDGAGDVIGMDTAASSGFELSSQTTGQGFAIAIDAVKRIAAQIRAGAASNTIHLGPTAFIGVEIDSESKGPAGAAVSGTVPGTAAANAGLDAGDVITALGTRSITSSNALTEALVPCRPGQRVTLTWLDPAGVGHSAVITLGTGPAA